MAFPKCTGCSFRAGVKKPKRPVGGSLSMNSEVLLATEPRFGSFWGNSPGLGKGCRLAYLGSLGSQTGSGAFRVISAARAWRSRVCRRQSLGASPPELSGRFNSASANRSKSQPLRRLPQRGHKYSHKIRQPGLRFRQGVRIIAHPATSKAFTLLNRDTSKTQSFAISCGTRNSGVTRPFKLAQ